MTAHPLHATTLASSTVSGAEGTAFWILGAMVVLAAIGVVLSRRAVHSAIMMAVVMLGLAVFYGMNQAPFLMVAQIVVYTGAVLMLFLFVLMLVGVSSADSLVETLRGHRALTVLVAAGFVLALVLGLTRIAVGDMGNLDEGVAAAGGNVSWIATEVIFRYVIAFEATGALLITAVLGALVLAHSARVKARRSQKVISRERIRGDHATPLPGPGTYARHNAIDMPALLPDGSVSRLSLNPVLTARDPELQSDVPQDVQMSTSAIPEPGGGSDSAWSKEAHTADEPPPGRDGTTADETDNGDDTDGGEDGPTWTR